MFTIIIIIIIFFLLTSAILCSEQMIMHTCVCVFVLGKPCVFTVEHSRSMVQVLAALRLSHICFTLHFCEHTFR